MKENIISVRNLICRFFYKAIFRRVFFRVDPEIIHDRFIKIGEFLGGNFLTRGLILLLFSYSNDKLLQTIAGIKFENPVGLAAGFDKDGKLTNILPSVGFGYAEIGSITGESCPGNSKPRLWRLPKSKSLIVNYGLKNEGCEKISKRLKNRDFTIPIGTSIAKTNNKKTAGMTKGVEDYVKAYKKFTDVGSYFAINISCPNTFGGQPFTDPERLDQLLGEIDKIQTKKPIFLKLSPDLTDQEIDKILKVASQRKVDGFICTNLSEKRDSKKIMDDNVPSKGTLSGKLVEDLANQQISYVYQKTKGKYIIIGCGGIFSAEDAYKKIKLGASLTQLITGMIYEGPQLISEINQGLIKLLKKDGYESISQAIGAGVNK